MGTQSTILRDDEIIHKNESLGKMKFDIEQRPESPTTWLVQDKWTNIGKTDAIDLTGWISMKVVNTSDALEWMKTFDFLSPLKPGFRDVARTVIPTGSVWYPAGIITVQEAADQIDGKVIIFVWGHIEYKDIFGAQYYVNHCQALVFSKEGQVISSTLPHPLMRDGCNRRIEKPTEDDNKAHQ